MIPIYFPCERCWFAWLTVERERERKPRVGKWVMREEKRKKRGMQRRDGREVGGRGDQGLVIAFCSETARWGERARERQRFEISSQGSGPSKSVGCWGRRVRQFPLLVSLSLSVLSVTMWGSYSPVSSSSVSEAVDKSREPSAKWVRWPGRRQPINEGWRSGEAMSCS